MIRTIVRHAFYSMQVLITVATTTAGVANMPEVHESSFPPIPNHEKGLFFLPCPSKEDSQNDHWIGQPPTFSSQ